MKKNDVVEVSIVKEKIDKVIAMLKTTPKEVLEYKEIIFLLKMIEDSIIGG